MLGTKKTIFAELEDRQMSINDLPYVMREKILKDIEIIERDISLSEDVMLTVAVQFDGHRNLFGYMVNYRPSKKSSEEVNKLYTLSEIKSLENLFS